MDIYQALTNKKTYESIIELEYQKFVNRYRSYQIKKSSRLQELDWIFENRTQAAKIISKTIKNNSYQFRPVQACEVQLDKKRILYLRAGTDKILEASCTELIRQQIEPHYSSRLFSYQKGKGSWSLLAELANYIKRTTSPIFIIKTDFKDFGDSIEIKRLFEKLKLVLAPQSEKFWELLRQLLVPTIETKCGIPTSNFTKGLGAGFSLTPILENIYCNDIDLYFENQMELHPSLLYSRFGDDMILASSSLAKLEELYQDLTRQAKQLGLHLNPQKEVRIAIKANSNLATVNYRKIKYFDHLGSSISEQGEIFLAKSKLLEVKQVYKKAITITAQQARKLGLTRSEKILALISASNALSNKKLLHPYLQQIPLKLLNQTRAKEFDKWIALLILNEIYGFKSEQVFQNCSYKNLRKLGLNSLFHDIKFNQRHRRL